ncbi:MAG: (2Fe-2S) ferredoxin domain-containing protein [Bdellovibrionales bacterium]|nr:(2Fe-2S) ferredoxin domain-containing protein [Bdellovibrionales bacterium]
MYDLHIFVCTNQKILPKVGCQDRLDFDLVEYLRTEIAIMPTKTLIRVNKSGCLGQCSKGSTVVIYPQNKWFFGVNKTNVEEILTFVENAKSL